MAKLVSELRRRKVLRTAAMYIVAAWVAIQVAGEAFEAWGIADSNLRLVWIAAALGLPVAIVVGWRYDIVGGRIVRTPATSTPVDTSPLETIDYVLLAALTGVVAAIVAGVATRTDSEPDAGAAQRITDRRTVAVLPFENMSGDETNRALTVGLHDDILTQIAKIGELRVISRTSVARLDSGLAIPEIGALLGVAAVLEGGVQRVHDELRVNVQLIDARTDEHLWAETYNGQLSTQSIFAVQSKIAESVATALRATLTPREVRDLDKVPTDNLQAYEAYLLGTQAMALRTTPALERAATHFSTAISLDPTFARAYVGLADTHLLLSNYGSMPEDLAFDKAADLITKALDLDSHLGEAYAARGHRLARQSRWKEAAVAYERAIDLNPNYASAYHWFADSILFRGGSLDKARELLQHARALDPLSPVINVTLGEVLEAQGRLDEALTIYRSVLKLEPEYPGSYHLIGQVLASGFGRVDEGVRWHVTELDVAPERNPAVLGLDYLVLGDDDTARRWLDRARSSHPQHYITYAGLIEWHRYRNEATEALALVREMNERFPGDNQYFVTMVHFGRDRELLDRLDRFALPFSCDRPVLDRGTLPIAINLSLAMERTGRLDCARRLLTQALEVTRTMPRLGRRGYGIADVEILARLGRRAEALATLDRAVAEGWRASWRSQGLASPHLASLHDDPEFRRILEPVRADMARQLARVRELEAAGTLAAQP